MHEKEEKRKVQVGEIINIKRGKTAASFEQIGEAIPIYEDWTPELQKRHDETMDSLARVFLDQILEYQKNGGDLSNLGTLESKQQMDDYYQKKADAVKRKRELTKARRKMTDEDLEEFLKWKESSDC